MSELKYIFGPVPSRRLGRSLGINIISSKICSMDCVYCEVGKTEALTIKRKPYIKARNVIEEFEKHYDGFKDLCDVITITGAGEPTLNSELDKIFSGIKDICDKPVAILTNAASLKDKEVYETLLKFDIVVPSLDAVSDDVFNKINMPHKDIRVTDIVESLTSFSREYTGALYVEILFCKGLNDSCAHIEKLAAALKKMRVTKVQAGSIHRPPAYSSAGGCDAEFLLETVKYFIDEGIAAEVTSGFSAVYENSATLDLIDLIPSLLIMRPCTLKDMSGVFGKSEADILKVTEKLAEDKIIKKYLYDNEEYFIHSSLFDKM